MTSRTPGRVFYVVVLLMAVVLGAFAFFLVRSQADSRDDINQNFSGRADIAAALTESLFAATSSSGSQPEENMVIYGGQVTQKTMDRQAKAGNNAFLALISFKGKVLATSSGVTPELESLLGSDPAWITGIYEGEPYGLSDVLDVGGGKTAIGLATRVPTDSGDRVLASGIKPGLLTAFIGGYLAEVPTVSGGMAYMLDENGNVIASGSPGSTAGEPVGVPGLAEAVAAGDEGEFGDDERFAAAPVANSSWKVVSTAPESSLYASVSGADRWVPWLIFVCLALAAATMLVLIRRSFIDRGRLAESNVELASAQTMLRDSNEALERRAQQLARSNSELDQFASIASHDLQEPLRKVQTFSTQVLSTEADNLSEKGRDYLQRANSSAARMQVLIEDLLLFSRVGTQTQPFVETDMNEIIDEVLVDLETTIEQAGATVEVGDLPTIPVDPRQARQLFQNLISNSLKFRREGVDPVVQIDGSTSRRFAEITVADNGIGFDPEYGDRIFRVFERLHERSAFPGTGIGLALCRKVAERHGGTIGAVGRPGEGATFVVRLPLDHPEEAGFVAAGGAPRESNDEPEGEEIR
jgi:signal transduction histidine kinase